MPRTLAVLLMEMLDYNDSYSNLSMQAADSRAREREVDLLVAVGRRLDRKEPDAASHNLLYRLILDRGPGPLVVSHTVYQHLDEATRADLARRFPPLSTAVTTVTLGGFPRVWFRNEPGMADVVGHLIHHHGKSRVLFVTGTEGVEEATVRRRVWEREMEAAHLPSGPEWVVPGHFNPIYCPGIAAEVARRVRALGADAVVTCSDLVAAVLLRELPGLGIRVPGDVAVTGFDDIPLSEALDPPLTTVRQPIWDQFRQALDLALDGGDSREVSGGLVVRESCGCARTPEVGESIETWRRARAEALESTRALRAHVAELNLFAGQMAVLEDLGSLGTFFEVWMPRLGFGDFFLSLACEASGQVGAVPTGEDWFTSPGPQWHRACGRSPTAACNRGDLFIASQLAPAAWWESSRRRTILALPLAQGTRWFGLLLVEGGPESFLLCRTVQELVSSFLARYHLLDSEAHRTSEARLRARVESEKNKTLGTLLAGFSHDLATPFSVGRDSTALLLEQLEGLARDLAADRLTKSRLSRFLEDGMVLARTLDSHWNRAIELVDRFKRIGTEIPRDGLRTLALGPYLTDLLKTLQPMWRHTKVEVVLEADPGLEVQTRPTAFVDIVSNLVQNALVHAFPDGQPGTITVSARSEGSLCFLEVSDNGPGVADELREQIFEPYFTTRDGKGGTGLGLAIVRDRVEGLLGGRVSCALRPGGGTRFVVEFPLRLD